MQTHTAIFDGMFDDAALFPPGEAHLHVAVPAHLGYKHSSFARLTGPFVLPGSRMEELAALRTRRADSRRLELALTFPHGPQAVAETLSAAAAVRGLAVVAVELALPPHTSINSLIEDLATDLPEDIAAYVEIPRDERRGEVIDALADANILGKFRTGGVSAQAYPSDIELAVDIRRGVERGLEFKATAGLHHAIRNTDSRTGFEQHGFLNLIAAIDAAIDDADAFEIAAVLAQRDEVAIAAAVAAIPASRITQLRRRFRSFGTCSIIDPLTDLIRLGFVSNSVMNVHYEEVRP